MGAAPHPSSPPRPARFARIVEITDTVVRLVSPHFDVVTFRRALDYVSRGRVHVVKPLPFPVVARVRGTEEYVVTVWYDPVVQRLGGECSCPMATDCKHVAATAMVVFAQQPERNAARLDGARQAVVGDWLAELGHFAPTARGATTVRTNRVIAYVLDDDHGDVGVTPRGCTPLRKGGLGAGSPIAALGDPSRGAPTWIDHEDLRRVAMMRAVSRVAPMVARIPLVQLPASLIHELADTGRLFWEDPRHVALSWGPQRQDALRWRPVPDEPDAERLGLDGSLVIVPTQDCLYVDRSAGTIGPLDLGLPSGLVQRLIQGPPVPSAMRGTVERSLAPLMVNAPPSADEELRPHFVGQLLRAHGRVDLDLLAEARYGDARFRLGVWDPEQPHPRDLVAEGRHRGRLAELMRTLPQPTGSGRSLDHLAAARHIAEVVVPALHDEGWTYELSGDFPHEAPHLDVEWVEELRPTPDGRDWFSLDLGVTIAGRTVPLLPILLDAIADGLLVLDPDGVATVGSGLNLRLPDGELVHVPAARVTRWLRPLIELELRGLDAGRLVVPTPVATELAEDVPGAFADPAVLATARERLAKLIALEPRAEGKGFTGKLRPYQRLGHAWLRFLHDAGYGGVLSDEMGLGKTVQVLAFLDGLRAARKLDAAAPALVVAPRSVVGNWRDEAARFAPRLEAATHLGAERGRDAAALVRVPLLITSYQTLARDLDRFREIAWTTVLFDESQAVKNSDTQLRRAAAALRARSRFCITGTPIENHLGELWSQVDLAMPGLLGSARRFDALFRRPIEKHGASAVLEHLRARVRPFLLRRTKLEVDLQLPPLSEVVERIDLEPAQRDLYESLRLTLDERVRAALVARGIHGASMAILDALLKLRQCCCDPRLLPTASAHIAASAKLTRLMEMLGELVESERATLVFSQFTSMLDLIREACAAAGIVTLSLTGETRDREDVIRRFQAGEAPVFLISLKAGGVGVNLTRADTVIHYDPWWNPAAEAQATARAHRIGQDRPVVSYKLVARGTLEETIVGMQDDKRRLSDAALRDGGVTKLAAEDLHALYQKLV